MSTDAIVAALSGTVEVSITTVGIPPKKFTCSPGTTVADFKSANGLSNAKLAVKNPDGSARLLADDETISSNTELYTSTAKENG